jgi:hypothetical protein
MQREEWELPQRAQRKSRENAEKREFVTVIEEWVDVLPWSLHSAAGAPKCGAEGKSGHSGRDDREENPKSAEDTEKRRNFVTLDRKTHPSHKSRRRGHPQVSVYAA